MKKIKKSELKNGDIVLYPPHNDDWLAKTIAWFTKGEVNHAAILYDSSLEPPTVIESVLDGVGINPIPATGDNYYLKIFRRKNTEDLTPVLDEALKYNGNEYPYINLGLLAILILFGKYSTSIHKVLLYKVMKIATLGLMIFVQNVVHKGKQVMSCSQFTAQSFTDAGKDYSLKFENLVVDTFGNSRHRFYASKEPSCLAENISNEKILYYKKVEEDILNDESRPKNFDDINNMLKNIIESKNMILAKNDFDSDIDIKITNEAEKILVLLDKIITGNEKKRSVKEILTDFQKETYRNFFVTPEDFNINCSSIEFMGNI